MFNNLSLTWEEKLSNEKWTHLYSHENRFVVESKPVTRVMIELLSINRDSKNSLWNEFFWINLFHLLHMIYNMIYE